jgi:hypothetical protein
MAVRCSSTIPVSWTSTRGSPRSSATDPHDERKRWGNSLPEVLPSARERRAIQVSRGIRLLGVTLSSLGGEAEADGEHQLRLPI